MLAGVAFLVASATALLDGLLHAGSFFALGVGFGGSLFGGGFGFGGGFELGLHVGGGFIGRGFGLGGSLGLRGCFLRGFVRGLGSLGGFLHGDGHVGGFLVGRGLGFGGGLRGGRQVGDDLIDRRFAVGGGFDPLGIAGIADLRGAHDRERVRAHRDVGRQRDFQVAVGFTGIERDGGRFDVWRQRGGGHRHGAFEFAAADQLDRHQRLAGLAHFDDQVLPRVDEKGRGLAAADRHGEVSRQAIPGRELIDLPAPDHGRRPGGPHDLGVADLGLAQDRDQAHRLGRVFGRRQHEHAAVLPHGDRHRRRSHSRGQAVDAQSAPRRRTPRGERPSRRSAPLPPCAAAGSRPVGGFWFGS